MVSVGCRVVVMDGDGVESELEIVEQGREDVLRWIISDQSPLARAILGHVAGDTVRFRTPAGPRTVTVVAVAPA